MKDISKYVFLICINAHFTYSYKHKVECLVELVKSYEKPTAVSALLCWNKRLKIELADRLGNLKRPVTIRFINEEMRILEPSPKDAIIVTDLTCPGNDLLLNKANNHNIFATPYRWVIFGHHTNKSGVIPVTMEDLNILHDSEVIVTQQKAEGHFEIHLVYKYRTNKVWIAEYYGNWMNSTGLQISDRIVTTAKTFRRRNLEGETLAIAFNVDDMTTGSFSTQSDVKIRNAKYSFAKWGFKAMLPLYEFMNASRVNIFANSWGYFVNGSWNGVVGTVARGEADLSGMPLLITEERMKYVRYITNTIHSSIKFMFREPPLSYQNNLFLLPFNKAVWCSIALLILLMVVVIHINARWEARKFGVVEKNNKDRNTSETDLTISDVLLIVVGALSQRSSSVEFRGFIGRLVMFTLFFTFLLLFTAYSASIVVLLQSSSKQIRTLSDLLNSRLELGVEDTPYNHHYFSTASDPVRKAIYETKVAPKGSKPHFMSFEDGVQKLQRHPFAFFTDTGKAYRIVAEKFYEYEKCGLQEISFLSSSKPWSTCRKSSPYAELLKIGMLRIFEHGMNDRVNRIVYARKPICSVKGGIFESVSIIDVYPSLLMLLYGTLLAVLLLVIEILVHRYHQHRFS